MIYTVQAQSAIAAAIKAAKEFKHPYVGTEHLLLGLLRTRTGVAAQVMAENGVNEENMTKVIRELLSVSVETVSASTPEISPRLDYILDLSKEEAYHLRSEKIGTEHMLLAIIRENECAAAKILQTLGSILQ